MMVENMMQGFHFLRPWWLLLLPVLLLLLWYLRRIRLQSGGWQTACDAALLPHLLIAEGGRRQRRSLLLLTALAGLLAITALAGPAWKQLERPVFRDQSALVVLLDLSRSMDATDVRPTRLTRARLKLIDILKQRREGQAALIVYAAEPFVVSPLTEDAETIIAQVGSLTTTMMPSQGSRSDLAVGLAQELLVQAGALHGELLLITDGVENVPQESLHEAVTSIVQAGYRLSILGVGDAAGAPIALADGGFLKDRSGAIVIPRLDEPALRELAQQGDGRYQAMRVDDRDISTLLQGALLDSDVVLEASQGFKADQWREEGPWLLLLILPLVLIVFRRGHLLMICLVVVPPLILSPGKVAAAEAEIEAGQSWWGELWSRPDQRAARAFERDDHRQAAQQFEDSEWKAAAHYRAGDFQQSIAALEGGDSADALYNKGNAHAQLGQWRQALEAYEQALSRQPQHRDAAYNRDLVKQQLQQQSEGSQGQSEQQSSQQGESPQERAQQDASQTGQSGDAASDQSQSSEAGSSSSDEQREGEQASSSAQRDEGEVDDAQREAARSGEEEGEEQGDEAQAMARGDESQQDGEEGESQQSNAEAPAELSEAQAEIQQANDQWLRRIPDDPGGLLRRKFQYQSQRAKNRSGGQQRIEDESW